MADHYLKHRFRGRRKGKPMTAYRNSLINCELQSYRANIDDLANDFKTPQETWLEVGFGNGEFLSHMCQSCPDINFIGCEPFINGVAALLASLEEPVNNLKIWDNDARLLIDKLPDASIDRIYLLNPDPWPKTRHKSRRFISKENLDSLARILKPDGQFIMSTDVKTLAIWMHDHTLKHELFKWNATLSSEDWLKQPIDWPINKTRYMSKALGGEDIYWLQFKRKP